MTVQFVGASHGAGTTSSTSTTVTLPADIPAGALGLIWVGHSSGTVTPPAGWVSSSIPASNPATAGSLLGELFAKTTLGPSDSGTTVTFTCSGAHRHSSLCGVYSEVSSLALAVALPESASDATHSLAADTAPAGGCVQVGVVLERSSAPSTSYTPPSGFTARTSTFGSGSGAVAGQLADKLDVVGAGGGIGGGDFVGTVSNLNAASWLVALVPVAAAPNADAGPDQFLHSWQPGQLDGSASTGDEHYLWSQTSGPVVALSSATAAEPTFTCPVGPATLVFQLQVTNEVGVSDTDSVTVYVAAPGEAAEPAPAYNRRIWQQLAGVWGWR